MHHLVHLANVIIYYRSLAASYESAKNGCHRIGESKEVTAPWQKVLIFSLFQFIRLEFNLALEDVSACAMLYASLVTEDAEGENRIPAFPVAAFPDVVVVAT